MTERRQTRALGLISGGLDSMLAARLLMEQGVAATGVAYATPFFGTANAEAAARRIGFPLIVRDITAAHLAMARNPPSGYGAHMNPCIDCHALMLRLAGSIMDAAGFDLLCLPALDRASGPAVRGVLRPGAARGAGAGPPHRAAGRDSRQAERPAGPLRVGRSAHPPARESR